ncbi:hypothetical protein [Clostridium butyricum]|uniref:hypothetical protein n=1 Tax=Clostridium butyricum TaxID=1492 RepID=UPI00325A7323
MNYKLIEHDNGENFILQESNDKNKLCGLKDYYEKCQEISQNNVWYSIECKEECSNMLDNKTLKYLEKIAKEEVQNKKEWNQDSEVIYVPVVVTKEKNGRIGSITNFNGELITYYNRNIE